MKRNFFILAFTGFGFAFSFSVSAQELNVAVRSQTAIAMDLESNDPYRVSAALEELPDFYNDNLSFRSQVSSQVAQALMSALENEAVVHRRMMTDEAGDPVIHDLLFSICDAVIALKDPASIPLLMDMAHYGNTPVDALLEFGPQIIPVAMEYAMNSEKLDQEISGSLHLLQKAILRWGEPTPSVRIEIKDIVLFYLNEYPERYNGELDIPVSSTFAMYLASVLGDSDLKKLVEKFVPIQEATTELYRSYGADMPNFVQEILDNWEE